MGTTPIYNFPYPDPTDLVRDAPDAFEDLALAIETLLASGLKTKKVETFTASGTWTPPTGVDYAIVTLLGGGAGNVGRTASTTSVLGANGGTSSFAFPGGTKSGLGGIANKNNGAGTIASTHTQTGTDAAANSGRGGGPTGDTAQIAQNVAGQYLSTVDARPITHAGAVTAGVGVTVTVGAGGVGGGATTKGGDGGSGYVIIEYYEA